MFISFEGIDGAGKTTASQLLVETLAADGMRALHLSKKEPCFDDEYVSAKAIQLKHILWPSSPDEPQFKLGDHFFLWLTAAWLKMIDDEILKPKTKDGFIVVMDGWYYKTAARHSMRPHVEKILIEKCFRPLSRPDLVILLDVPAVTAARRKSVYSNAEAGLNDGGCVKGLEGFVAYQERCRHELHEVLRIEAPQLAILNGSMEPGATVAAAAALVAQLRGNQAE